MSIFAQALDAPVPEACRRGAITIGNFDGVHLGHQALLIETMKQAHSLGGPAVAVTFDPHPQQLLRPEAFEPTLTTVEHRAEVLQGHGVDHVLVLRIDHKFLQVGARAEYPPRAGQYHDAYPGVTERALERAPQLLEQAGR